MKYKLILFTLIFFFLFSSKAFAEDFIVTGKVLDQNNNPVPKGIVEFVSETGEKIESKISAGEYSSTVPKGVYSIKAVGPSGSALGSIEKVNQAISSDVSINMTIAPIDSSDSLIQNELLLPALGLIVVGIVFILLLIWFIRRN